MLMLLSPFIAVTGFYELFLSSQWLQSLQNGIQNMTDEISYVNELLDNDAVPSTPAVYYLGVAKLNVTAIEEFKADLEDTDIQVYMET